MKNYKIIYITSILSLLTTTTIAQNNIDEILKLIEKNNKTIQTQKKWSQTLKLEAQTGKYLANPSAEFERMWGNRNKPESEFSFSIKQTLDFPTAYRQKNKLAHLKTRTIDYQMAATRQEILLKAKQTCLEIIYLQKQQQLLEIRLTNAQQLADLYQRKFETGDANQLEINKTQLELLAIKNQHRLNKTTLAVAYTQLQTLNGGESINLSDLTYPTTDQLPDFESLTEIFLTTDPVLKTRAEEQKIAHQEVKLNRSLSLPKFDLGYKRNSAGNHVSSNGFTIGISIPLFENKYTVKKAKAQAEYAQISLEEEFQNTRSSLRQEYELTQNLLISKNEYSSLLKKQRNIELLNKSLQAGQLSLMDYYSELAVLYNSEENLLKIEQEYHSMLARLFRYKL